MKPSGRNIEDIEKELKTEEDLVAYHLGELSRWQRMKMRRRLESDAVLAAQSEKIAATLRVFCCDPPPVVSEAALERSWQRVRGSLGVLEAPRRSRRTWAWGSAVAGATALVVFAVVVATPSKIAGPPPVTTAANSADSPKSWSQKLIEELHRHKAAAGPYNHRPGPLTTEPVDAVAEDPALATHLDRAERVLTEVSHTDGPLQPDTREQVHRLLLENAVYHQSAEQRGDRSTAAVIDDLGRVLTSLDAEPLNAEPQHRTHDPDAFRLQMNLGGVLLDLRILHHNDSPSATQ
jgi:hypothetical protein